MLKYCSLILINYILLLSHSTAAFSEELRIFDPQGLIRAFSKIEKKAAVQVSVSSEQLVLPPDITLSHLDGLSPDRKLIKSGTDLYRASDLDPGSWKIILPDRAGSDIKIRDVKIFK